MKRGPGRPESCDCGHEGHQHGASRVAVGDRAVIALVGSPNAGKTSVFSMLTGIRAKTGNYPGVTVSRSLGTLTHSDVVVEDLPGAYSLDPISPDERIVYEALQGERGRAPDALAVIVDATMLPRSLRLVAEALRLGLPTCLVLTLTDELVRRGGGVDAAALSSALGIPVVSVVANRGIGTELLRTTFRGWHDWSEPVVAPPDLPELRAAWIASLLDACDFRAPRPDSVTSRVDAVLLHPVWGLLCFFVVMFAFFQVIFTVASPLQGWIEDGFGWLSDVVDVVSGGAWWGRLVGEAVIGGVGSVLVFLPQIVLLFLLISLLEGVGYMARAAFLMDRVMAVGGLEGRAFVAMLSSFACAVPGIMATRTLPNAKDRIATILSAPLITCSARLPVYILLVGMLVPPEARFGPISVQGLILFALYLLGGTMAMLAAAVAKRAQGGRDQLPFYMELPPYRVPTLRSVFASMWVSGGMFLRKCGTIILGTSVALWLLLNLPVQPASTMAAAGVDTSDDTAVAAYTMDHSAAAWLGRAVEPVFEPLGFDWRVDVGIIASLSARETFVATLGQVAAASDPDDPSAALEEWTYQDGEHAGERVFSPATITALLLFFACALQCMSTVSVMRRETGGWKWPIVAWSYLFVLAWVAAFAGHTVVAWLAGGAG